MKTSERVLEEVLTIRARLRSRIINDLKTEIYAKTYAVEDKIHDEILRKAVSEKVILQSYDSFGHRIYVLPVPASQEPELPL